MKKTYYLVGFIIVIIFAANFYYYFKISEQQISLQKSFLMKQALIAGNEIEKTGYDLESELSKILFNTNISGFLDEETSKYENSENEILSQLKSVYFKHKDLISNIQFFNNKKQVFSLYRDRQENFITDYYSSHEQKELFAKDTVLFRNGDYLLYLPVISGNNIVGNLEVLINYEKYLKSVLIKSHIEDVQWQWIIDSNDEIIYINLDPEEQIKKILLSGGGGSIKEFRQLLAVETSAEVQTINPFENIQYDETRFEPSYIERIAPQASICMGLAIRRVDDK